MKMCLIDRALVMGSVLGTVGALGCATLSSLRGSVLGSGRTIAATNAMTLPICQVDVTYGGKTGQAELRENASSISALQGGLRPGQRAYLVLPFDPAESPTFDLGAHVCASDTGSAAAEDVVASIKGLHTSDIDRLYAEPVVLH
jgi:hypothetical protein